MPIIAASTGCGPPYIWAMTRFDATALRDLRAIKEVRIRTWRRPASAVVIWVVVADDAVFVRSFRGAKGRWYQDLAAGGEATLEVAGRSIAVRAIPEREPAAIERVSREFLRKYQPSSYAEAMVQGDILATTLRLEPR